MIQQLRIRNYVLIEELDLDFDQGLTIITGETGAGKSILLGALGLVLGDRAESGVQADPEVKTIIEATFQISAYHLEEFFATHDLDYHAELILRRELSSQGRSRAFINDSPAGLGVLRELGRLLLDIHQQFDQLDVLEEAFHIRMLDALAEQRDVFASYQTSYRKMQETRIQINELQQAQRRQEQERDFLSFQLDEISKAQINAGEQESLESEDKSLRHAEEIRLVLMEASRILMTDDQSALPLLQSISRSLGPLREVDHRLQSLAQRLESLIIELQDWVETATDRAEEAEGDPARLEEVTQRLNLINRLLYKHKVVDADALIALAEGWQEQLAALDRGASSLDELEKRLKELEVQGRKYATQLTTGRQKAAIPFIQQLQQYLANLGMERIQLRLQITESDTLLPTGADVIRFEMAQMEGSKYSLVKQAASGGELSRLTLVIKRLVAAAIPLPTLVFDEIDAGVSGAVSMKVGDILTQMAQDHQLIIITHSPQIAARAGKHLFVSKSPQGGKVRTSVRQLDGEERVAALATMLSTDPPGPAAVANARELLAATHQ